jgi:hypothetical protein
MKTSVWSLSPVRVLSLSLFAAGLPLSAAANVSASLGWKASPDPNVAGYTVYYGCASHQYTHSISVGQTTNVLIPNLPQNSVVFFSAKARDDSGDESDFSNEAAFAGYNTTPDTILRFKTMPTNSIGDLLSFSLGANAPAGATINPTNGTFSWQPGRAYASTTNYISIAVTDTANPALSISETLQVAVSDYLECCFGSVAVAAGGANSMPFTVASSSSITNLQITMAWPGDRLINPSLSIMPPATGGYIQYQNGQLIIQIFADPSQPLTGTNQVGQINFQAVDGQASMACGIPVTHASGISADGVNYGNVLAQSGEIVVVGNDPMLRPKHSGNARTLSLYANPGNYQLFYATSLAAPVAWKPLMSYQQTNIAQSVSLDASAPVVFYKLEQM